MFPRSPEEEEEEFQERDEMLQLAVVSSQPLSTLTTTESYSPSKESLLKKINRGKSLHATQYCDQSYLPSIVPKIPEREETDKSATTTHKQTLFNKICSPPRSRTLSPGKKTESKLQTHDRLESAPAMKSLSLSLPPIHSHFQKTLTLQNPWNFDANAVYGKILQI